MNPPMPENELAAMNAAETAAADLVGAQRRINNKGVRSGKHHGLGLMRTFWNPSGYLSAASTLVQPRMKRT
jgi:hypothetical protein